WSLHGAGARAWIDRLTWETPWAIITMFRFALVPVVLAPWSVRGPERIWLVSTAAFVLLYWFGSSSLSSYTPLPISGRMMLPFLPGILMLAASASDAILTRVNAARWRIAIAIGVLAAIVYPAGRAMITAIRRPTPETDSFAVVRAEAGDPSRHVVI